MELETSRRAKGPSPGQLKSAAEAETHYRRMWRLRGMSSAELAALLAGDPAKAAPWIESAARYGLPEAQLRLGQMRLDGTGVTRDEASALAWFIRAANAGSPAAMNMAGRCYENAWGSQEDLVEAARWYRLAAETGYDWGQYNYANMLFDGRGVACDQTQAFEWYRRAADQGHARAMNLVARSYEEGWGAPRDRAAAYEWYRRSADAGYFRAQFNLGTLLVGEERVDEAIGWFEKACRAATPDSLANMLKALIEHGDPRLAAFGRQIGEELTA